MKQQELSKEQIDAFLEGLTELSRKHGIAIWGCGCCGSPRLALLDGFEGFNYCGQDGHYSASEDGSLIEWEPPDGPVGSRG